jgi:hypothetical protein
MSDIEPFVRLHDLRAAIARSVETLCAAARVEARVDVEIRHPKTHGAKYVIRVNLWARDWRSVLGGNGLESLPRAEQLLLARHRYREAAKTAHPDVVGGSAARMLALNVAMDGAEKELSR